MQLQVQLAIPLSQGSQSLDSTYVKRVSLQKHFNCTVVFKVFIVHVPFTVMAFL